MPPSPGGDGNFHTTRRFHFSRIGVPLLPQCTSERLSSRQIKGPGEGAGALLLPSARCQARHSCPVRACCVSFWVVCNPPTAEAPRKTARRGWAKPTPRSSHPVASKCSLSQRALKIHTKQRLETAQRPVQSASCSGGSGPAPLPAGPPSGTALRAACLLHTKSLTGHPTALWSMPLPHLKG